MTAYNWYSQLIKPKWAPPAWLFGPVWTVLYVIITLTYGIVFYESFTGTLSLVVALPFVLNLVFNFAFTPIQFGLKNNLLAGVDILFVLGTLLWALVALWQASYGLHFVVYANMPYLLWVCFATVLQLRISYLNR